MIPRFKKSRYEPKPIETDYWIDLNENEYGGVFKYYDTNATVWKQTESITKEKEPQFTNSPAYKITTDDINSWNNKVNYEDFDAFKEEMLDLGSKFEGVTVETLEYYIDLLKSDIHYDLDIKADKASTLNGYGIKDAYTKKQIDTKFAEWKVELPENVSHFKNDIGYVTESNLEEKLPDHIVSDANYVHTDNNFNNSYKNKLDNLTEDLKAIEYDDTEVKNLINQNTIRITSLQKSVEEDIAVTVESMSKEIAKKANADEVYTKHYLDEVFTQFVRKTHKTYGFVDDRPTKDLETSDTGFIFYDYTVNEPLLWVADEWRLLRTNESFDGFLLEKDISMPSSSIGNWEFIQITEDFTNIVKYIGEYTTAMNLEIPNIYSGLFVLELGTKRDARLIPEVTERAQVSVYNVKTDISSDPVLQYVTTTYTPFTERYSLYPYEKYKDVFAEITILDILGNICAEGNDGSISDAYGSPYKYSSNTVSLNSFSLPQGIRKIHDVAFHGFKTAQNNELIIPAGVEELGISCFKNSSITSVEFPRNPIKLGSNCFYGCPITKLVFPKTLDYDDIIQNGGGHQAFAYGSATITDLILAEGVRAIPNRCFLNTPVKSVTFPKSLEYIGPSAFYESGITGSIDTTNIKSIGSFAFRNAKFNSITIGDNVSYIAPNAFQYTTNYNPCTYLKLGVNLEHIYQGSIPMRLGYCGINIPPLPKVKCFPMQSFIYYGYALNNIDISIELSDSLECIGPNSFTYSNFNNEIILPESLKYIGYQAFAQCNFSNETLIIPKNVRMIGGMYSTFGCGTEIIYDVLEKGGESPHIPYSKNGYSPVTNLYEYLEDGGELSPYSFETFYGFGNAVKLNSIKVDEQNQWFKDVDGVLFSKDGKRLICYPHAKKGNVYEIPEGCVYCDAGAFFRSGFDHERYSQLSSSSYKNLVQSAEDGLQELIIPNSMINYTPSEMKDLFPTACVNLTENMLFIACNYFSNIKKITVKDDNPRYKNDGDWLLSKDGTTLQVITCGMTGEYRLPNSVTTFAEGAVTLCSAPFKRSIESGKATYVYSQKYPNDFFNNLTIHIPTSVVNIDEISLYTMNVYNTWSTVKVKFILDEGNPAFIQDSSTYIITRI